jgi:hypothetical protein
MCLEFDCIRSSIGDGVNKGMSRPEATIVRLGNFCNNEARFSYTNCPSADFENLRYHRLPVFFSIGF